LVAVTLSGTLDPTVRLGLYTHPWHTTIPSGREKMGEREKEKERKETRRERNSARVQVCAVGVFVVT